MKNIVGNFINTVNKLPDKPFLVENDTHYSYSDILSMARRVATYLHENGVASGDRIILNFPNSIEYLSSYIGGLLSGCTCIPVDFRSRPNYIEYVSTDSGAKFWLTNKTRKEFDNVDGQLIYPSDIFKYKEIPATDYKVEDNPLALIMYTSGTTGAPKGVCLKHSQLLHTIQSIISWANIDSNDKELSTLSLTHLFGLAHVHCYWTVGGTVYIEENLQNVSKILERITWEGITSFPGTPGGFKLIVDQFSEQFRDCCRKLKYIIVNSAPMKEEYIRKIMEILPHTRMYMYYGLTEASRSSYICYNDHPDKLLSVGKPTPGSEVCVGSPVDQKINEEAELHVRGPHVTDGYLGIDSSQYFIDGWFKTGDLGCIDEDGFITWKGRIKEQINIDGLKLNPIEVENVLLAHEKVKDCAVVGVPDDITGEKVVGFVVPKEAQDQNLEIQLRLLCKKELEIYKIPKQIIFVENIPRTDTGKPKRYQLRESYNR